MVIDMMTAEQLKGAILQLAMQGKLVEQRPEDNIFKPSEFKNKKTEELEIEIPETWRIAHLESIVKNVASKQYQIKESQVAQEGKYTVISQSKEYSIGYSNDESKIYHHNYPVIVFGDHTTEVKYIDFDFIVGADGIKIFEPNINLVDPKFLYYQLQFYTRGLNKMGGYSRHYKFIKNKPFILPPLAEQKRIVARIEELMPFVEQYAAASTKLNTLNASFPEMMKKSILQEAVQGKLVPQDPNDEPASVLLEKIAEEKKRLIKEGKIKKQKPLPAITEDEIPFDIPDSWEWVRLAEIGELQTGTTPSKAHREYFGDYIPFVSPGDISSENVLVCKKDGLSEMGLKYARLIPEKSVLQVCIGGSIGKAAINYEMVTCNQQINTITPFLLDVKYLFYCMISECALIQIKANAGGTATPIINKTIWGNIIIPIAPFNEQKRIVTRAEELMDSVNGFIKVG